MTLRNYKVLLLVDPFDVEYKFTLKALEEAFAKKPECEISVSTDVTLCKGFLGTLFHLLVKAIMKHLPNLYGKLYNFTNESELTLWIRDLLCKFVAARQENLFKNIRPDIIVAAGVIPAGVMNIYKEEYPKVFGVEVIPQFSIHQWWLNERTNLYFLAGEDLQPCAEFKAWQKTFSCGIPVGQAFKEVYNREYLRMKLGWKKDDRVCVIIDDKINPLPLEDLMTSIVNNYDASIKFMVVVGKNVAVARQLRRCPYAMKVFGYVEAPAELMNCADYLITRARGAITAEALTTPAKYIVYNPLPGTEIANAEYLHNLDALKIAVNPFEVANKIKEYDRADNIFLGAMGKPMAADYIAEVVLREIN